MKKIIGVYASLVIWCSCFGQVQAIEQLTLDIEKLAQMKAMLNNMYNGYANLKNGYRSITGLAKSNFDLHQDYLNQLLAVHIAVKNDSRIESILSNYGLVGSESAQAYAAFVKSMILSVAELGSIKSSLKGLQNACNTKMDELQKVLSPGILRMSDAERIATIDRIDHDVGVLLEGTRKLISENYALVRARADRKKRVEMMKRLNGIK